MRYLVECRSTRFELQERLKGFLYHHFTHNAVELVEPQLYPNIQQI